jgi:hypothetical protein
MPDIVHAQLALKAVLLALAFLPAALMAADAAPAKSGSTEEIPTVELTVTPAATPVPALKYRLLTTSAERTRGNAALDYYRAIVQNSLIPPPSWLKDGHLIDTPLEKFPQKEAAQQLEQYRQVFIAMERAAHRDHCEWQIPLEDGFETQLPEFQNIRDPVRLVITRARLQMARGEFGAALDSFRINYELSQRITECHTIINSLIGVAITALTREQLETFVQQPHAPNLYWTLSELPVPLVDIRGAIVMEPYSVENSFPQLVDFRSRRLTRDEAHRLSNRILEKWIKSEFTPNLPKTLEEAERRFAASSEAYYPEAKQLLIDAGRPKDEVDAMPLEQVVWLASFHRWHLYWDDLIKWSFLPAPERHVGLEQVERRLAEFHNKHRDAILDLTELFASVPAALAASDRADRQLALLRVEEAIRLHAHAHAGMLPPSLEAIDEVPIPVDPVTGKAFRYRVEKNTAVVETPSPPANVSATEYQRRRQERRYIIHLRK